MGVCMCAMLRLFTILKSTWQQEIAFCVWPLSNHMLWVMQKNQSLLADQQRPICSRLQQHGISFYLAISEKMQKTVSCRGASCLAAHAASCWVSTFTGNSIGANLSHGEKIQILKWMDDILLRSAALHIFHPHYLSSCLLYTYIPIFMTQDQAIEWFCAKP